MNPTRARDENRACLAGRPTQRQCKGRPFGSPRLLSDHQHDGGCALSVLLWRRRPSKASRPRLARPPLTPRSLRPTPFRVAAPASRSPKQFCASSCGRLRRGRSRLGPKLLRRALANLWRPIRTRDLRSPAASVQIIGIAASVAPFFLHSGGSATGLSATDAHWCLPVIPTRYADPEEMTI